MGYNKYLHGNNLANEKEQVHLEDNSSEFVDFATEESSELIIFLEMAYSLPGQLHAEKKHQKKYRQKINADEIRSQKSRQEKGDGQKESCPEKVADDH